MAQVNGTVAQVQTGHPGPFPQGLPGFTPDGLPIGLPPGMLPPGFRLQNQHMQHVSSSHMEHSERVEHIEELPIDGEMLEPELAHEQHMRYIDGGYDQRSYRDERHDRYDQRYDDRYRHEQQYLEDRQDQYSHRDDKYIDERREYVDDRVDQQYDDRYYSRREERCRCCPYGHHIDVDFVNYCDNITDGSYLKDLKRIRNDKRKLRKSMEVFLDHQQRSLDGDVSAPPPDVVNSSESYMNLHETDDRRDHRLLQEIDQSVTHTLGSIDHLMHKRSDRYHNVSKTTSSDSYDEYESDNIECPSPAGSTSKFQQLKEEQERRYRSETNLAIQAQAQRKEYEWLLSLKKQDPRFRPVEPDDHPEREPRGYEPGHRSYDSDDYPSPRDYPRQRASEPDIRPDYIPNEYPPRPRAPAPPPRNRRVEGEVHLQHPHYEVDRNGHSETEINLHRDEPSYPESEMQLARPQRPLRNSHSVSSLHSAPSSDSGDQKRPGTTTVEESRQTTYMYITAAQLGQEMAKLLPPEEVPQDEEDESHTSHADIGQLNKDQLEGIREQMAISLARMRELEEQVKAIPVLQVRIAVLKEEKRLLELQMKAKNSKMNMRSVGVGDYDVDEVDTYMNEDQVRSSINFGQFYSERKVDTCSIGVGDFDVYEELGPVCTLPHMDERQLHTEQSSHIFEREREINTLIMSGKLDHLEALKYRQAPQRKPYTRSIGVGDDDVYDNTSNIHVHEKETRTVILGGATDKKTRNVGVMCKSQLRDVGIMYVYEEEKPAKRSVGCGVTATMDGSLVEWTKPSDITQVTHHHMSLQQLNMAAFHQRNIHIRKEDISYVLDEKLRKSVHSVGCMATFSTEDKGTYVNNAPESRTVGCGEDTIDVVIRPIIKTRSIGVDHHPSMIHRSVLTEKVPTRDTATGMRAEMGISKMTNTDKVKVVNSASNTENVRTYTSSTETDTKIFQALDMIRNAGTNTIRVPLSNCAMNTDPMEDPKPVVVDKWISTAGLVNTQHRAINTDMIRHVSSGVGDKDISKPLECDTCAHKPRIRHMGIGPVPELVRREQETMRENIMKTIKHTELTQQQQVTQQQLTQQQQQLTQQQITQGMTSTSSTQRRSPPKTVITTDSMLHPPSSPTVGRKVVETTITRSGGSVIRPGERTVTETITQLPSALPTSNVTKTTSYSQRTVTGGTVAPSPPSYTEVTERSRTIGQSPDRPVGGMTKTVEITRGTTVGGGMTRTVEMSGSTSGGVTRTVETSSTIPRGGTTVGGGMTRTVEISGTSGGTFPRGGSTVTRTYESSSSTRSGGSVSGGGITRTLEMGGSTGAISGGTSELITKTTELSRRKQIGSGSMLGGDLPDEPTLTTSGSGVVRTTEETVSTQRHVEGASHVGGSTVSRTLGDGGSQAEYQKLPGGGTQMKVMRHVETSYVGSRQKPVHESSELVFCDASGSSIGGQTQDSTSQSTSSSIISGGSSSTSSSLHERQAQLSGGMMQTTSGGSMQSGSSSSCEVTQSGGMTTTKTTRQYESPQRVQGRTVTVTETRVERRGVGGGGRMLRDISGGGSGSLKSIMKSSSTRSHIKGHRSSGLNKKELKFAEGVVGGYVSSSASEDESASEGEISDQQSPDEGSYDGRLGQIIYKCADDESIAQGAPGATMYDQNIRETFELAGEMQSACEVYASWLDDSTTITSKQLNSAMNVIQQEWFKVSSHKLSNQAQVEDFLTSFSEISKELLEHVVNMTDANGNTALHYAVSHCNMDIVNLLLDSGCCDVNKQNRAGYTIIMLASLAQIQTERHRDIVHRLFNMGDVNLKAAQAGQTALMLAVSHGRLDMVKMLLEAGAAINTQDDDGSTALMCACEHGHVDIVKVLLAHPDCDPTIPDNDGSTAMSVAMEAGHRDVGVLLYAHVNFKSATSPVLPRSRLKRASTSPTPIRSATTRTSTFRTTSR